MLDTKVDELEVSVRSFGVFEKLGLVTVADLVATPPALFLKAGGNALTLREVREILTELGVAEGAIFE